ncbi:hypothetical protein QFZ76_000117 [Streptomyces sp. V4I2]|nr:hypothetical protein [Streptomyces sp. V4I2]
MVAYDFPFTRQYGKNSVSTWRHTFPVRLVRVPPARSTTDLDRLFAG